MRRRVAPVILLLLACAASLAGCDRARTGSGGVGAARAGEGVGELAAALGELTQELTTRVESNADTKAGVADAQKFLDARRAGLASRIDAFKRGGSARDPEAKARWLEAEVDNTQRLRELQLKHLDASMHDPELKAALERLAADYDSMFKDRSAPSPLE